MNDTTSRAEPVKKREIFGWCCFDFANSAFTTVITTAVYLIYFKNVVMEGSPKAPAYWGLALALAQLGVILVSPLVGAMADLRANKKGFLMITAITCSIATAALFLAGPGDVALSLGLVVIATFAFAMSENLCAGFLPEISTPETAGRISGYGWSFGYIGGLICLVLAIVIIEGGPKETQLQRMPWTFVMTGAFFLMASLPTFLLVKERAKPKLLPEGRSLLTEAFGSIVNSLKELPKYRTLAWFLISLTFSTAGLTAVVAFAGGYADDVLKMSSGEFIKLLILLQLTGIVGAYGFGFLQDKTSSKLALSLALVLWIAVCVGGAFCASKGQFYVIGGFAGVAMGALQSAGRAVVSTLTPEGRSGEFFGFWGFFTKLAGVVGQPIFGFMAMQFGFRAAILANAAFFVVGLLILLPLSLVPKTHEADAK